MKLKKTAFLLSLCTAFTVCGSAEPALPFISPAVMTADAASSNDFTDVDGSTVSLGDGIPTAVVYGRPICYNTSTTLRNIISAGLPDSGELRIIYADVDGNDAETVKDFRDELGSDKIIFCSGDNSARMFSSLDLGGSFTLPAIGYYDGAGTLLGSTTGLQEASAVRKLLTGTDAPPDEEDPGEDPAVSDEEIAEMGYKYEELEDGTIMITGVDRMNGHPDLVIPSQIDGKTVTRLGDSAFEYSMMDVFETEYTSVTIPDTVTWIGDFCFWHQKKLAKVDAPDSLEHIGANAFNITAWLDDQSRVTDIVTLSDIIIEGWHCADSVIIPDGIKAIADHAFTESYLETIYIPSSVQEIGKDAFAGVKGLTIYCEPGSYAESFANENGFPAVTDGTPIPEPDLLKDHLREPFLKEGSAEIQLNPDGTYTMVQVCDYSYDDTEGVNVAVLDPETMTLTHLKCFDKEDDEIGGTFLGERYNFIVCGNDNYSESDDAIVLRICKYSKTWEHLGDLEIKGANTYDPFRSGNVAIDEYDGRLYIHTCHTMYASSRDGLHHQANMTFIIDEEEMSAISSSYGVSSTSIYTSHSFAQAVAVDETGAYFADLGDAYPRAVALSFSALDSLRSSRQNNVFDIYGATGNNSTGVYLGDLMLTDQKCLLTFASVEQKEGCSFYGPKELYLAVTDKETKTTELKKVSGYSADKHNSAYDGGALIRAGEKNYLIWSQGDPRYLSDGNSNPDYSEEYGKIMCAEISNDGEIIGSVAESSDLDIGYLLPCSDGMIRYVDIEKNNDDHVTLYTLDPATLTVVSSESYKVRKDSKFGDVNADGFIDASDASEVLAEYAATQTGAAPELDKAFADVNADGFVDASDASSILQYYAYTQTGGTDSFPDFISSGEE